MSIRQAVREQISTAKTSAYMDETPPAQLLKSMKDGALACRWNLRLLFAHYRYLSSVGLDMFLDNL